MRKLLTIALVALSASTFAQSVVKNGTIYKEHPYITAVLQMNALYAQGDSLGAAKFYADSARFIDASNPMKPSTLKQAISNWHFIFENWSQISVKEIGNPDGLEYADGPFTVQSWWEVTAVNKKTQKKATFEQVVFDTFDTSGKISSELSYYDTSALIDSMK